MNNFTLFNILLNVVKTTEFTISMTCLILETLLIDASSSLKYKEISSLESHIFSGFFGIILLVGVFTSGLYCFTSNGLKKSDIVINSAVGILWIFYTLLKIHYYIAIHISDYYNYNPSTIPARAWLIRVGYNTYILTILLGSINIILYFISTILLWRLVKNENGFVMNDNDFVINDNKTIKENNDKDLEKLSITELKV
ncbi:hypothetical protein C1646_697526 [Rhizophagus diaphanus]|nr:hypothetical protein C1646_697526 [Rhizophagus diaphanus] [Rhizophagus sp. MUCL 43196]